MNVSQERAVPENIYTPPMEGIGISLGVGGSARPKNLKKGMKLFGISTGVKGGLTKNPFCGEVWIFSGITQYSYSTSHWDVFSMQMRHVISLW